MPEDPFLQKGGFSAPKDIALDGGKKGYELICRFLNKRLINTNLLAFYLGNSKIRILALLIFQQRTRVV